MSEYENRPYLVQTLASLVGLGLSLFLLVQHNRLRSGIQETASLCSIGKLADCDVVHASRYAEVAGVPVAAIGAAFFFLLFLLGTLSPPSDDNFKLIQKWMARLCLLALAIDAGLLAAQALDLQTFCLYCILTYVATIVHYCANATMCDLRAKGALSFFINPLLQKPSLIAEDILPHYWILTGTAFVTFLAALWLLPANIWMQSSFYSYGARITEQFYKEWPDKPKKQIEVLATDGTLGPAKAPVTIVEFSDFECPHCRKAAFTLHASLASLKKKARFVFKHYPLDSSCNPSVNFQAHRHACRLAQLAVCATRLGKFWDFHDRVFFKVFGESGLPDWDVVVEALEPIFTREQVGRCLSDSSTLEAVKANVRQGDQWNVNGTPAIFVNGKAVTIPLTVDTLTKLIELEQKPKR